MTEMPVGGVQFGPPKSAAGHRVVALPRAVMPELIEHVASHVADDLGALVFTGPTGSALRHGYFRRRHWLPALAKTGLVGTHFHDLRHTGNNLTAGTGATLRELMDRMGHSSSRAALIYLHGSDARQQEIAASISKVVEAERKRQRPAGVDAGPQVQPGTQRARGPRSRAGSAAGNGQNAL